MATRCLRTLALLVLAPLLAGGCATFTAVDRDSAFTEPPQSVELDDVPFYPQEALQCGPAALAEVLQWSGRPTHPDELEPDLFIPERGGSLQAELRAQTRARDRVPYRLSGSFDDLLAELHDGNPVLVMQNLGLGWLPMWHYAVVVGFDADADTLILRSGPDRRRITGLDRFRRTWERAERWAIVVVEPDRIPASATPGGWLQAALELEESDRDRAARAAYAAGRARWPRDGAFHVALVNLHHGTGDADAAVAAARRGLLEAESETGVLHNNLAMLLMQRGNTAAARAHAEAALDHGGPHADAFRATLETIQAHGNDEPGAP